MRLNQKGAVQFFPIAILLVGLIAGLYLVQTRTNLLPKASESICADDLRYCDTIVGHTYHKHGGYLDPENELADENGCVYAFDKEGACEEKAEAAGTGTREVPKNLSPKDDEIVYLNQGAVKFEWEEVAKARLYNIFVMSDQPSSVNFQSNDCTKGGVSSYVPDRYYLSICKRGVTDTSYTISTSVFKENTWYFWGVDAYDKTGSPDGNIDTFYTDYSKVTKFYTKKSKY